jgi:small-conductance mechanosensitive channel
MKRLIKYHYHQPKHCEPLACNFKKEDQLQINNNFFCNLSDISNKNTFTTMRNFILILSVIAIGLTSCEDENKTFIEKHNQLLKENDSLKQVNMQFQRTHQKMKDTHAQMQSQVEAEEIADPDLLEKLARHEVLLKKHEALMKGHEARIEAHESLRQNFSTLNPTEMQAQIAEMQEGHNKLMADHETIREEHEQMEKEHTMMLEQIIIPD